MNSVFTQIIRGELPCFKIYETENIFSFLALHQVNPGHTLVVPKVEVDHWVDCENDVLAELTLVAKDIAIAIQKTTDCIRVGNATVGFEVPHYHLHLIPMWDVSDINFSKGRILPKDEMESIADKIRAKLP